MKKYLISGLAITLAVGFSFDADAQSKRRYISIGTGGPTGVYF